MGSCLTPFIANVFMRTFETNLKSSPLFPRIWQRYVDDIFAVTKREKKNETLTWLNSHYPKTQLKKNKPMARQSLREVSQFVD
jgi:hypothetical protein